MTFRTCSFERELTQALVAGHWPHGCTAELRAHVDGCTNCRDLVLVTQTFQNARRDSERQAPSGSPGMLWWRAQLRLRNTAAERVSRPLTIAQMFAWGVVVLVGVILVTSQYWHGVRWASWWSDLAPSRIIHLPSIDLGQFGGNLLLLIPAFGIVLLSGIVVYLASERL